MLRRNVLRQASPEEAKGQEGKPQILLHLTEFTHQTKKVDIRALQA